MHRQAILIPPGKQCHVLLSSIPPGFVERTGSIRESHSIDAGGAMVQVASGRSARAPRQVGETAPRSDFLATIDVSVSQESFPSETHVGLHYYRGCS